MKKAVKLFKKKKKKKIRVQPLPIQINEKNHEIFSSYIHL